ncbi:sialidase family protein [Amycolatopsis sp. NPDC047767]|uniref:sialidase family protein n=1 Tax=Amycolatopsis sp. NPDC047767 TaxID=3156765 RepID=UPI0034570C7D
MKILRKVVLATAASASALSFAAVPANAQPLSSAPYGAYANEGTFPSSGPCPHGSFRVQQEYTTNAPNALGGLITITVRLYYYGACGAFAEAQAADSSQASDRCSIVVDRSDDGGASWSSEEEWMDNGWAETKIANNLNGRLARGALVCDNLSGPLFIFRTNWY